MAGQSRARNFWVYKTTPPPQKPFYVCILNLIEIFIDYLLYSKLTDMFAIFTEKRDDPNKEIEMGNTFDIEQQKTLLLQQVMTVDKEMKELEEQTKKRKLISDQNNITLAEKNIKISKHIDEGDYNLDELIWPDPNPEINQNVLMVDDVTQMNAKEVDRIFMVRTTEDVQHVLKLARMNGKTVSMRGTKHSMGGHTIG